MIRRTPLQRSKKAIPRFSKKRITVNRLYSKLRADYIISHPYCQWFMAEHGVDEDVAIANMGIVLIKKDGEWIYLHIPHSTQVHHKKGRGKFLLDVSTWMAVSDHGHKVIHHDTKTSYERGYMLPRN